MSDGILAENRELLERLKAIETAWERWAVRKDAISEALLYTAIKGGEPEEAEFEARNLD